MMILSLDQKFLTLEIVMMANGRMERQMASGLNGLVFLKLRESTSLLVVLKMIKEMVMGFTLGVCLETIQLIQGFGKMDLRVEKEN